jgi:hypothetical protein
MITIFHLMQWGGIAAGLIYGWSYGEQWFGVIGAVTGAILGAIGGNFIGILPLWIVMKFITPKLSKLSEQELRQQVSDPECMIPNLILLELSSRNLNIENHISDVLNMLRSEDTSRRGFGLAALNSVFPNLASEIDTYSIDDSVEQCINNTLSLEKYTEQKNAVDS